jgi:hypothetical protein
LHTQTLPENSPRAAQALMAANDMVNVVRMDDRASWASARAVAARFLHKQNSPGQFNVTAIGHCRTLQLLSG